MSDGTRSIVNQLATSQGTTPAEVVRRALEFYNSCLLGGTDAERRRLFTHEFLFLVVDRYLAQTDQQTYDQLVSEADRRVGVLYARS